MIKINANWPIGLICLFSSHLYAQKHILPAEIKEKRQAIGLLENTNKVTRQYDFRSKVGGLNPNQITSTTDTWLPGEFEESQAVVIGWGSYDAEGNVDTTSNLAEISSKLCIGIQPEAIVLIRINQPSDSFAIKRYMDEIGSPLYNYRFVLKWGDDWWARDFGPIGYYQGDNDSLVMADFKYYPGREHDNSIPATVSHLYGFGHKITRMNFEGGNLIADGFGKVFYSDVVSDNNSATGTHFPTLASSLVADSMRKILQANQVVQLPALNCDGGTGHLDLYLKMMDEETWIAGQYPSVITASDKTLSENNVTQIKGMNSVYGRPYRVFRIPLPTDNNGSYNQQLTCNGLNNAGRSFINGITVNKTFIYPIWDGSGSGNVNQRLQVEANLKKWFPGMKLFGIDVRAMTGFGGQLHCITMQVPASNPVKFWHPAFRDAQVLKPSYHLVSTIKNKSGINIANCLWRKGANGTWNTIQLTDSSGYLIGDIPGTNLAVGDTIQYYLKATTNNGKTAYKPITAPEGFFEFVITSPTQISLFSENQSKLISVYPNPGNGEISFSSTMSFKSDFEIQVYDFSGRKVLNKAFSKTNNPDDYHFNINHLKSGIYLLSFISDGKNIASITYNKN